MSAALSFLRRLGNALRVNGNGHAAARASTAERDAAQPADRPAAPLRRAWPRRGETLEQLRDGYERLAGSTERIAQHLDAQQQRSDALKATLETIRDTLIALAEAQHRQTTFVSSIATQLDGTTSQLRTALESLHSLPAALREQHAALERIGESLAGSLSAQQAIGEQVVQIAASSEALRESSERQTSTLNELDRAQRCHGDAVRALLDEQTRRLTLCAGIAIGVLAVGFSVLAVVLWRLAAV